MRIVTRADFDGVVCAVLLYEVEDVEGPVNWVEPNQVQKGMAGIRPGDIMANLPYDPDCELWFDHHYTNRPQKPFKGAFSMAPSAARVIFEHYAGRFKGDYRELVDQADKIDAAELTVEEVKHPENHPYILLSMTLSSADRDDEPYWNRLVHLLRSQKMDRVMGDPEVQERCQAVIERNRRYEAILKEQTRQIDHVAVSDFRSFADAPSGNRFLIYSLYPESVVQVRVRNDRERPEMVIISVGHSIFNRNCNVNVGLMLSLFGGGGHAGAGSCTVPKTDADEVLEKIIGILQKNQKND